ncbi:MAG: hypothetical protein WDN72_03155 [Alphaproteobacteria bacterium]
MHRGSFRIFRFLLPLLLATNAHAGAWTEDKGETLLILQAAGFASDDFFDKSGHLHSQPRFTKAEQQPYVEYGLKDWLTLGGTLYLQDVQQAGVTNLGLGDPTVFARLRLWRDAKNVVSVQPLLKLPSWYEYAGAPRGGGSSTDEELALLYGRNLNIVDPRDYLDLAASYRNRSEGLHPQLRADAALGLRVSGHVLLVPAVRIVRATSIGTAFSENGDQDYDLTKVELTGEYLFDDDHWVQATAFDHVAGRNTGNGVGIAIAYAERF